MSQNIEYEILIFEENKNGTLEREQVFLFDCDEEKARKIAKLYFKEAAGRAHVVLTTTKGRFIAMHEIGETVD